MIKVTDVIDYVHRFTLNMTNLNTAHKRKDTSRLYRIVQDDFATTVTTKWKSGLKVNIQRCIPSMLHGFVFFFRWIRAQKESETISRSQKRTKQEEVSVW